MGLNEAGFIRLQLGDKTLLINGVVYASTTPALGRTKVILVPVNATLGYQRKPEHKKYLARNVTGETFRVIGTLVKTLTTAAPIQKKSIRQIVGNSSTAKPSQTKSAVSQAKPLESSQSLPQQKTTLITPAAVDTKKQTKLLRLQKEFQRVAAQRASGIDPAVRMAFCSLLPRRV